MQEEKPTIFRDTEAAMDQQKLQDEEEGGVPELQESRSTAQELKRDSILCKLNSSRVCRAVWVGFHFRGWRKGQLRWQDGQRSKLLSSELVKHHFTEIKKHRSIWGAQRLALNSARLR